MSLTRKTKEKGVLPSRTPLSLPWNCQDLLFGGLRSCLFGRSLNLLDRVGSIFVALEEADTLLGAGVADCVDELVELQELVALLDLVLLLAGLETLCDVDAVVGFTALAAVVEVDVLGGLTILHDGLNEDGLLLIQGLGGLLVDAVVVCHDVDVLVYRLF